MNDRLGEIFVIHTRDDGLVYSGHRNPQEKDKKLNGRKSKGHGESQRKTYTWPLNR